MNGEASVAGGAAAGLKGSSAPTGTAAARCASATATAAVAELRLGDEWRVSADDALIASLRDWLAPENVEVVYG
jgi:DNA polymerase-3 subunit alpha